MIHMNNSKGASKQLPISMSWKKKSHNSTVGMERLTGGGATYSGSSPDPATFSIEGTYCFGDPDTNRSRVDALHSFLEHQPIEVSRDGGNTFMRGYVTSVDTYGMDGDAEIQVTIGFIAPDPYFYGEMLHATKKFTGNGTMGIQSSGNTLAYPKVTMAVVGSVTDPKLVVGDYELLANGTYTDGVLVVDSKSMRATFEGSGIFGAMGHAWAVRRFALYPEEQQVEFSGIGTYTVTVDIEWRARYRR